MWDFIGLMLFALFGLVSLITVGSWTYLAWRYGVSIPGPTRRETVAQQAVSSACDSGDEIRRLRSMGAS